MRRLCISDDSETGLTTSRRSKVQQVITKVTPEALGPSPAIPESLRLVGAGDRERPRLEQFIRDRFREDYSAQVSTILPMLLALYNPAGEPVACLGLSSGKTDQQLFLENYLEQPADLLVSGLAGSLVRREKLVEIGNLEVRSMLVNNFISTCK